MTKPVQFPPLPASRPTAGSPAGLVVLRVRPGAALLVAVLVMLVLDCVVLGTVHLALLERRLADNSAAVLRLRLAAEGAIRESLTAWNADADTMAPSAPPRQLFAAASPDGLAVAVNVRRAAAAAFLLQAEARQPPPRLGTASAMMMVLPPALPPGLEPVAAALTTAGPVTLGSSAVLLGGGTSSCAGTPGDALRMQPPAPLTADAGAQVSGAITDIDPAGDVVSRRDRLFAAADSVHPGDVRLTADHAGPLLVRGSLRVNAGVTVTGFVVVGGDIIIDSGATIEGAVHVAGAASIDGTVVFDRCTAERAVATAALQTPRPGASRAWLPAF